MNKKSVFTVIAFAVLFTLLFYKRDLGFNLLIFEFLALTFLTVEKKISLKDKNARIVFTCLLASSIFSIINYSLFGYIIHFVVALLFVGILIYPQARSIITSLKLSLDNILTSQRIFIAVFANWSSSRKGITRYIFRGGIFIIPAFIVVIFFLIYQKSNPVFEKLFTIPLNNIVEFVSKLFGDFNFFMLFVFFFGLFICNIIFLRKANKTFVEKDVSANDDLVRTKKKKPFSSKLLSLKNEYCAAVFLFFALNALLLILNVVDVYSVWFHFEWKGQYLKQYVHEGTYLLIISIIISIVIVLYYFRGNLNHYPKQKLLKTLALIWLAQNALLVISVAIRNFWYIHYFALAYKRIGVYIFLCLTMVGLYTVWIKVRMKKSRFYLLRTNSMAWLIVLTFFSSINWDNLIAKYNFSKTDKAFVELGFLAYFPDKSLPYLDKDLDELNRIDATQKNLFHFDQEFMKPAEFNFVIQTKKKRFIKKWQRKDLLEWNYAEWKAYQRIK